MLRPVKMALESVGVGPIRRLADALRERSRGMRAMAHRRLSVLLWLAIASLGLARVRADETPPNVVLIVADDLGWADLGCYGSTFHKTPHLDALATSRHAVHPGLRRRPGLLADAGRPDDRPPPGPARAHRLAARPGRPARPEAPPGPHEINAHPPADVPTSPALLKKAGYTTGLIGKWHLGGKGAGPLDRGFDVGLAGDYTGTPLSHLAPYKAKDGRVMPGLEEAPAGGVPDRSARPTRPRRSSTRTRAGRSSCTCRITRRICRWRPRPELVAKYPKWDGVPHGRQEQPDLCGDAGEPR